MKTISTMSVMHRIEIQPGDFLDWREGSGGSIEIFDIQVNSNRRVGIGTKLIDILIHEKMPKGTRLIWAITRSSNRIAQDFYSGLNFKVIGVLRDFYGIKDAEGRTCVDGIMYGLRLKDGKRE